MQLNMKLFKTLFLVYSLFIYAYLFKNLILLGTLADEIPRLNTNIDLYALFIVFALTLILQILIIFKKM